MFQLKSPVDEGKLNRFLVFLTPFMEPADVREVDEVQLDWFPIINSVSKSRIFDREGLLEVFLKDIWTKKIPKDIKATMIRDAHVAGFTKRALEISICLISSCESLRKLLSESFETWRFLTSPQMRCFCALMPLSIHC